MKTLEQRRANHAWECVKRNNNREYKTLAKGAPAMIMGNGLMQALAYYQGKSEEGKKLVKDIAEWLSHESSLAGRSNGTFDDVMKSLHEKSSSTDYMRVTEESLEILRWIKQFVSVVESEEGGTV